MSEMKLHWEDPDWLKQVNDWIHAETSRTTDQHHRSDRTAAYLSVVYGIANPHE